MTNCTAAQIEFPAFKRRQIHAQFNGGAITSDGGFLLLRTIDQRLKLTERVAAHMPPPVMPSIRRGTSTFSKAELTNWDWPR